MRLRVSVEHVFLVIGLGLLAGGVFWYDYGIRRPLTWPRADAEIVASRVVNPEGPNTFTPELVLRYRSGEQMRERTLVASWSSGSYDIVRRYVDGYPPGGRLPVAINPADPDDVRYELGATLTNLMGPLALGTMGVVFTFVFAAASGMLRRRAPVSFEATAVSNPQAFLSQQRRAGGDRTANRLGLAFLAIGVILAGITVMVATAERQADAWPTVAATVVESHIVNARSTSRSRSSRPSRLYDTQVTFRYNVNGVEYRSSSRTGVATSSQSAAEALAATYAPGTAHTITYRPDDPNVIRFEAGWRSSTIWLPLALGFMSFMFLLFGFLSWKVFRRPEAAPTIPDIEAEDAAIAAAKRFRPRV